jgi:hypothetical protein
MRTGQENPSKKEVSFKVSKKTKNKKRPKSNPNCICSDDSDEDE